MNSYVVSYDLLLNGILVYAVTGHAVETPTAAVAVGILGIHNGITTMLLLSPGFRLHEITSAIRGRNLEVTAAQPIYTATKLFIVAAICMSSM